MIKKEHWLITDFWFYGINLNDWDVSPYNRINIRNNWFLLKIWFWKLIQDVSNSVYNCS